jgi:DNA recombination protein RmuC
MDITILGIAGVIFIVALVLFFIRKQPASLISADELSSLKTENESLKISLAVAEQRVAGATAEKENITKHLKDEQTRILDELVDVRSQLAEANKSLESSRSFFKAQQEKLAEQKADIENTRNHFQKEFENVAEKLLKEKSREFTDVNKLSIDTILNPLKENIKAFEQKVDKVYSTEAAERHVLRGEISKLMELNQLISTEASNLTKALKGDNKKQGNWGEVILEKVLERRRPGARQGIPHTSQP